MPALKALTKQVVLIATPLFVLHLLEEWYTHFYQTDPSVIVLARYLDLPNATAYLCVQLVLFLFLALLLALIILRRNASYLGILLGLLLVLEIVHVTAAIIVGSYSPGLLTAIPLIMLGLWYWHKVFKLNR